MPLGTVYACLRCHLCQSDSTQLAATHWKLIHSALYQPGLSLYLTWGLSISLLGWTNSHTHQYAFGNWHCYVSDSGQSQSCALAVVRCPAIQQESEAALGIMIQRLDIRRSARLIGQ